MIKIVTPSTKDMNPRYEVTCDRCGCVFQCDNDDFSCDDRPCSSMAVKCPADCGFYMVESKAKLKTLPREPVNIEKVWRKFDLVSAMEFASRRIVAKPQLRVEGADTDEDIILFTDGTALAVRSNWDGPLSEVTPEVTSMDPVWRVYS